MMWAYMSKFLLVDDNAQIAQSLVDAFAERGLKLEVVSCGEDALQILESFEFDLILLDWNMTGITGLEVCKRYRKNKGQAYVIFLTGESDVKNKEMTLDAGGDDYIVKPFEMREVFARIKSVMRRLLISTDEILSINGLHLNTENGIATTGDTKIQLTPKEVSLLEYLMRHPNRPFNAQRLLETVWPANSDASTETVRTWMKRLREKLAQIDKKDFIKTVAGAGYVIESE